MGKIKDDRLRVVNLKLEREAERLYEQWLATRKRIFPRETFDLSQVDGWRLSLLEFEALIDAELKARQLEPSDYPPSLQSEFAALIAPRTNQKYIRRIIKQERDAA